MAYVPRSGSIQNTNFIAIGKTSSHVPAALVVANAIAEISAMFKRRQPEGTHSKARQSGALVVATASDPRRNSTNTVQHVATPAACRVGGDPGVQPEVQRDDQWRVEDRIRLPQVRTADSASAADALTPAVSHAAHAAAPKDAQWPCPALQHVVLRERRICVARSKPPTDD
jgi:hypothetical protein